ncbi:MAG: NAD-dependent succinate-semialdehyde dehydrogenase [Phycisphaerales bacterium]|nr:NAD-dependent succinate-semialdehyde dehydrogenase [Phycisphaerales bacterium]
MKNLSFTSINPADGIIIGNYSAHDANQIEKSLQAAHKAYERWAQSSFKERSLLLLQIAQAIRNKLEVLAILATNEMGKPITQSRAELEKCARAMEFYAEQGAHFLANELIQTEAKKSFVTYQPLGVVLAIMPWNFPYWQVFRTMAPIIMSGNAMLLKHASNVSGCALAIEKIMKKAKAPRGLFQTLLMPSSSVADMIAAKEIAAVTFTGSTSVGRKVAAIAAQNLKKQVLELGGSDAYIVFEDANIDLAVNTCFEARFINTGQSCLAAKRFIVVKKVRKEFEQKMLKKVQQATFGNPRNESHTLGPMARIDLRDELHQQVLRSIEAGAVVACGGFIPEAEGAFYPPTLLTNVKKGMPAYEEELFGPVAVIIEAKNENDAIKIANDSEFGLGSAIFSKNKKRAELIAQQMIQAGSCFVNAAVHSDPRLPFGGIKHSGYGRELSSFALREFVNIKTIVVQ